MSDVPESIQIVTASHHGIAMGAMNGNVNYVPPERRAGRLRILMLAANPAPAPGLALDVEAREIDEKLRLSRGRDDVDLVNRWAVRPDDLLQAIVEHRPHVVHFSGHGTPSGEIVLAGEGGGYQEVTPEALAAVFELAADTRVVVLNTCYSALQARAIGAHVDVIVGMGARIDDRSAAKFAAMFYSGLGNGRSVRTAFGLGVAALKMHGMPGHDVPQLLVRDGADPDLRIIV
jgi:hypothetical protein